MLISRRSGPVRTGDPYFYIVDHVHAFEHRLPSSLIRIGTTRLPTRPTMVAEIVIKNDSLLQVQTLQAAVMRTRKQREQCSKRYSLTLLSPSERDLRAPTFGGHTGWTLAAIFGQIIQQSIHISKRAA